MSLHTSMTSVNKTAAKPQQGATAAPVDHGANATDGSAAPAKAKILMVDDEKLNCYVVAEYLKSDGYGKLVHTCDPAQVLSLAARERPDAILLDIEMPRASGLEILRQIRAQALLSRTPVIIITASKDDKIKSQAFELGATDFLNKPIHCGELLARLQNILQAKAYRDVN